MHPARINPSIHNGPPRRISATATSSSNISQSVIVWSGDFVIDDTVSNTVNVNLSYDPLLLAGISAGILQDPSQESNMSPSGRQIQYSPLQSDFGESPVRITPPPRTPPHITSPPRSSAPIIRSRLQSSPLDSRRVGESPDISPVNVRRERPGRRNRARVSAAAASAPPPPPPCSHELPLQLTQLKHTIR